jgi:small-conductance mechanosensitive channel
MLAVDLPSTASLVAAGITILIAAILAKLVDSALSRRSLKLATSVTGRELSVQADTRLRLVRRLVSATILLIGIAIALLRFDAVQRMAAGILASGAILGLIVGFAARQTLANGIAGVLLAITQPIRVGDLVTFQGETGTVEDVRLSYTYIRADDGRRIIVPNEQLASGTVINHTIVDPRARVIVEIWIPIDSDPIQAASLLAEEPDVDVSVAEMTVEGVKLNVGTWAPTASERGSLAAGLRARCIERLHQASILGG